MKKERKKRAVERLSLSPKSHSSQGCRRKEDEIRVIK
jgi:hypothetical protein